MAVNTGTHIYMYVLYMLSKIYMKAIDLGAFLKTILNFVLLLCKKLFSENLNNFPLITQP